MSGLLMMQASFARTAGSATVDAFREAIDRLHMHIDHLTEGQADEIEDLLWEGLKTLNPGEYRNG